MGLSPTSFTLAILSEMLCGGLHMRPTVKQPGDGRIFEELVYPEDAPSRPHFAAFCPRNFAFLASVRGKARVIGWYGLWVCLKLEEAGQDFAGFAFDDLRESRGVERLFGADIYGAGAVLAGPVNEARRGINRAGGADDDHQVCIADLALYAAHFKRHFSEENDVRAQAAAAGAMRHFVQAGVNGAVLNRRAAALALAAGFGKLAVHVVQPHRAGALMQVVDVLRAEEKAVADFRLEIRQSAVRGIRFGFLSGGAAGRVKLPHGGGVALPGIGRAHVLDAAAGPQAVFSAKGRQTALGADARPGEHEDATCR